jgi:hypothetical protein
MRFDLGVASFGAPNASALPRVEGSLPCMPRLLFRIWVFLAAWLSSYSNDPVRAVAFSSRFAPGNSALIYGVLRLAWVFEQPE